ncbi:hypothetical protein PR048_017658 [Dryococelus australis]|uniref:UDP-glucuronosyltransferase n=1 Tax=Dryococelus australis TaxID=614101 RepID=A0ABQ9HAD0_9NEOP|nr:hypothetical protein PR048_017658 [Dryococelus australis]
MLLGSRQGRMGCLMTSLLACLVSCAAYAEGARILAILSFPSISHQVVYRALTKELARRGHQMVVVTPDPINDPTFPNYTEIDISRTYQFFRETDFASARLAQASTYEQFTGFYTTGDAICETTMVNAKIQAMIDPNNTREHFDLVFIEWLVTPCMTAFAHRFNAPIIGLSSLPPIGVMYDSVGNPTNPSYIPEIALPYTDRNRTFFQRLHATIYNLRFDYFFQNNLLPRQDLITKRFFGSSTPYIGDLHNQVSMLFLNYLECFHNPRPNVPAVMYVNGFHINPPKQLPLDIQEFLDSAPKGAIYFSLGSNVRSDQLTAEKRSIFLETFSELRDYHVLWKWESDNLPGQPANVKVSKWMPQQDILRHPKVKVFITQGGLQSTEEAIQTKVPMLGIPFFGDQDFNTKLGEDRGVTLRLEVNDLTKETLLVALTKVIEDKSYRENMERLSALVNDQITTPMERAVWWTEYVLRHKGAKHLRTAAVDMPWYTYLLLDIVLFLLVITSLVVVLLSIAVRFILRKLELYRSQKEKTN